MYRKQLTDQEIFLENIARKVWLQLSYAHAVEESLLEGSVTHLIVEEIDKAELEKLESMGKEASQAIDDMIDDASSLGFEKTVKYLGGLKKEVPSTFNLVKMSLTGDAEKVAKEIGKVTTTTTKINNVRDSFYDAVVLLGTELAKLEYARNPEGAAEEAAAAAAEESESGEVEVGDGQSVAPEEAVEQAVAAFKDAPLGDIAKNKFMTWAQGIKFPDESTLRKAAENSYKAPPEPEGFLGKVAGFFGFGTLSPGDFADDIMSTKLDQLIAKAEELKSKQKEAESEEKEADELADDIEADLQDLAQGDADAVSAGGAGGSGGEGASTTVQMPGVGAVPQQAIQQAKPGEKIDGADDVKGKKMVPMPELQQKVTAPEDVADMTDELAALINDDPKSKIVVFDPDAAEEAVEETGPSQAEIDTEAGEGGIPDEAGPQPGDGSPEGEEMGEIEVDEEGRPKKQEEWLHRGSLTSMLFESSSRKTHKTTRWAYKASLTTSLLGEAVMYKDLQRALKDQGVADADLAQAARDLAQRLENQYDVVISGLPEAEKELTQAASAVDDKLLDYLKSKDEQSERMMNRFMDSQDLSRQETMQLVQAVNDKNMETLEQISADTGKSVQDLIDGAVELGSEWEETEEEFETSSSEEASSSESTSEEEAAEEDKKPGKKRDRTGPPSDKMKERGAAVDLKPKSGESGEAFGKRVRRAEEKAGIRKKKPKAKTKKDDNKKSETSSESQSKSEEKTKGKRVTRKGRGRRPGFGTFTQNENAYYKPGRLTEALLGSLEVVRRKETETTTETERWLKLAGIEEK